MKNEVCHQQDYNVTLCCEADASKICHEEMLEITPCMAELMSLFIEKDVKETELIIENFLYNA